MYVFRTIVQMILFAIVLSYETRCPDFLELSILSKQCRNEEPFHCLFEDNFRRYNRKCMKWGWVVKGSFPVLSGSYIYYKDCKPDTYQPFLFKSNEGYKCDFYKSRCEEMGQVTEDNGTTITDRLCRCDHTMGYAFVVRPTNSSCNPVLEDCSCYLKLCDLRQRLNQDFICERGDKEDTSIMERSTINRTFDNINEETHLKLPYAFLREYLKYILTAMIVITLVLISVNVSVAVLCKMKYKSEKTSSDTTFKTTANNRPESPETMTTQYDRNDKTILGNLKLKTPPIHLEMDSGKLETRLYDKRDALNLPIVNVTLTESNIPAASEYDKPFTTTTKESKEVMISQFAKNKKTYDVDILILELELKPDMRDVEVFQDHLRSLVAYLGFGGTKIELFRDIYINTSSAQKIMLPELFKRCRYLFVYISNSYIPYNATKKGLPEKDLVSAMTTSEYRNIITVCDCESWNYPDKYRTDLNYFNYKQYKDCEAYKSVLRELLTL